MASLWALDKLPIAQAVREVEAVRERVSGWVQVLGPVSEPTVVAAAVTATPTLLQVLALVTETPAAAEPLPSPTPPLQAPTSEMTEATTESVTPTPVGEVTAAATAAPPELPTVTPTPEPTATLTPLPTATLQPPKATPTVTKSTAGGATTYRVQVGDTLSSIAARFGITWQELAAANGLTGSSMLSVGQELIIPASGASAAPTATPAPRATATPAPPSPTPQPQLAAPVLLGPGDQASYSGGDKEIMLTWQPVAGMSVDDQYQVFVSWVVQGVQQEHYWFWKTSESRVPPWLWGKADQPSRKYTWHVRAVRVTTDGQGGELVIPLSPASSPFVFYWN